MTYPTDPNYIKDTQRILIKDLMIQILREIEEQNKLIAKKQN